MPGCLLLSFFHVFFLLLASALPWVPAWRQQCGPGPWQLPLAIEWPSARREEAACSFFQQQRESTGLAFCFSGS